MVSKPSLILHGQAVRGLARIYKGGEGVTLWHTQGTYQIVMSTSMLPFTKSVIFSDEQGAWGVGGQAYKIAA